MNARRHAVRDAALAGLASLLSTVSFAQTAVERANPGGATLPPVRVTGARDGSSDGGVLGPPLLADEAPADVRTFRAAVLREPGVQSLASLLARDASVGENYATSGYYQNFTVRGYTLDLGSAYRINGFVVPGEFDIPLENMASVQILEGVAGLNGGVVGAGGTIAFATRRAGPPNQARAGFDSHGGRSVTLDVGTPAIDANRAWSMRVDASHAELRTEQPAADGRRDLVSVALDARPMRDLLLQADVIVQRRSQPAVPGFQLLGGTTLPALETGGIDLSEVNINRQPWSRPVVNRGVMADLHADWQLGERLWMQGGVAQTVASIDDNLATPSGCNGAPVQYFCSNGDYALYDYHARERRSGSHATVSLHGLARTGSMSHRWVVGIERIDRSIRQSDLYSATLYDANGNALSGNLGHSETPLPAPLGVGVDQPRQRATQRAAFLSDRVELGAIELLAALRAVEIVQQPADLHRRRVLPQLAASWRYAPSQQLYASTAQNLEFGSVAPLTAANAGSLLAPRSTRQTELGWKGTDPFDTQWSVAVFTMRRPYEFTQPVGASFAGLGDQVQGGMQRHRGLSLGGQTSARRALRLEGSLAWLQAEASGSGVAGYDGVQIQNVPRLGSFTRASYAFAAWPLQAHLDLTTRSHRNARRDGSVAAPGYGVVDAGAQWRTTFGARALALAATVRNVAGRRYWRDVAEAYSADLLFPGSARSMAISAIVDF